MIENTAYIALSKQMAMRRQLDVIANNLANMNTTAYRAQRVLFEEYLSEVGDAGMVSFVQDVAVVPNLRPGELRHTGNPLDLAISGPGYFVVQGENGERYTRNGQLRTDPEGRLVTADNRPLLDDNRQPIVIPAEEDRVSVRDDGTIVGGNGPIARLALVTFANEYLLDAVGDSQYETEAPPLPAAEAAVTQGVLEGSNVQPVLEMTQMTELLRAYQSTQDILERNDQIRRTSIQKLGEVV